MARHIGLPLSLEILPPFINRGCSTITAN